ncbi:anti-sigma factor [Rhodoferax sp. WC2427]|uniref:anti-sigma factor n=1 Tax=Rhodoferax sp. WC2427 TaxID=3234144 RepID=UPI00346584C6
MNPQQDNLSPDELAAEYVLGTLSATRRRMVEQRLPTDAALQAAVQRWQEQLLPLAALAEPVEPSAELWQRIDRSVAHAVAPRRTAIAPAPPPWWDRLGLWRGLAGAGFATAAILASVLVTRQGVLPAGPQYMVVLVAPQDKAPGWVIQASDTRQLSLTALGPVAVPAEKSLQFWTKGEGWSGPVSLGLVKPGQTITIPLDKLPPLQPNQLFELTLEPVNGSPLNKPTGPIQFIGRAVKVL